MVDETSAATRAPIIIGLAPTTPNGLALRISSADPDALEALATPELFFPAEGADVVSGALAAFDDEVFADFSPEHALLIPLPPVRDVSISAERVLATEGVGGVATRRESREGVPAPGEGRRGTLPTYDDCDGQGADLRAHRRRHQPPIWIADQ